MRLAIDAVGNQSGGGATVLLDLLQALEHHPSIDSAIVFTSPREYRQFDFPHSTRVEERPQPIAHRTIARPTWVQYFLGRSAQKAGADAVLCMNGMGCGVPLPFVHFVQQSLPFSAEAKRLMNRRARQKIEVIGALTRWSLMRSAGIAVQTDWMRECLKARLPQLRTKIEVFTPNVGRLSPPRNAPRLHNTLLYVGADYPHKGLDWLVEGFAVLHKSDPSSRLLLTVTPSSRLRRPAVEFLGPQSRRQLEELYAVVTAVVMPSVVETVGLPLVEAMASGTPILAADRPYAHDTCENVALFYEPTDPLSFVEVASRLLSDVGLREGMSTRGLTRYHSIQTGEPYSRLLDFVAAIPRR